MKVRLIKHASGNFSRANRFEATPVDRTGSPTVGRGRTMLEALGSFLLAYQKELGIDIEVDSSAQPDEERRRKRELSQR